MTKKMTFNTGYDLFDQIMNRASEINGQLTGNYAPSNGAILLVLNEKAEDGVEINSEVLDAYDLAEFVKEQEQMGRACADHHTTQVLRQLINRPPETLQEILDAITKSGDPMLALFTE